MLLSFTELVILQTLLSPFGTQTIPSFSLLLSFTELVILQTLLSPFGTQTIPSFSLLLSFTEIAKSPEHLAFAVPGMASFLHILKH